jgi:hypothetical protein
MNDLHLGIAAARSGDRATAHTYFLRVLALEPRNEAAWLWLSHVMPTVEQSLRCIEHLLAINPHHVKALEAREVLNVRLLLEEATVFSTTPATQPPTSTPQRRYLLGEALVEARVITLEQLDRALQEQARLARKGKPLRLGDVLLRLKLVRPEQLAGAIAAQAEPHNRAADGALGQLGTYLLRRQLVTRAQLHQALAQQNQLKQRGKNVALGEMLVRCGYLSRDQLSVALLEWQQEYQDSFV